MAVTLFHKVIINNKNHVKVTIKNKNPQPQKPKTTTYQANVITRSEYSRDVKKL